MESSQSTEVSDESLDYDERDKGKEEIHSLKAAAIKFFISVIGLVLILALVDLLSG